MERDYGKEIDALTERMNCFQREVTSQLAALLPNKPHTEKLNRVYVMHEMHPDSRLSEIMEEMCRETEEKDVSGLVTYLGVYNSGGRQSNWIRNAVSADKLLSLIESGVASKVLACIGNGDRLAILLEILRGPKTVAELVTKCGFGSTGQVYHHMKPLLAADIIAEDEHQKGVYVIRASKVQGIIMLLAGISDMVDSTYTEEALETTGGRVGL